MAIIVPRWDGVKTGGASTANEIRSRLPFENTHLSMKMSRSEATNLPYGTAQRQGVPQLQTKFDQNHPSKTLVFQ